MFKDNEKCKKCSVIKETGHLKDKRADTSIYSRFLLNSMISSKNFFYINKIHYRKVQKLQRIPNKMNRITFNPIIQE